VSQNRAFDSSQNRAFIASQNRARGFGNLIASSYLGNYLKVVDQRCRIEQWRETVRGTGIFELIAEATANTPVFAKAAFAWLSRAWLQTNTLGPYFWAGGIGPPASGPTALSEFDRFTEPTWTAAWRITHTTFGQPYDNSRWPTGTTPTDYDLAITNAGDLFTASFRTTLSSGLPSYVVGPNEPPLGFWWGNQSAAQYPETTFFGMSLLDSGELLDSPVQDQGGQMQADRIEVFWEVDVEIGANFGDNESHFPA
jgi:hypothetical protein